MSYTDPRSGITFGYPSGADNWGAAQNQGLQRMAYLGFHLTFLRLGVNDPPANPAVGDTYSVGGTPTGAWSGYTVGDIAVWGQTTTNSGLSWLRYRPIVGMGGYDRDTRLKYTWNGSEWHFEQAPAIPQNIHFDPSTIGGVGSRTDPYRALLPTLPTISQSQADWRNTTSTSRGYIKNLPSFLRNMRRTDLYPGLAEGPTTFSDSGHAFSGQLLPMYTNTLATFAPTRDMYRLSSMGFQVGGAVVVRFSNLDSDSDYDLRVSQSGRSSIYTPWYSNSSRTMTLGYTSLSSYSHISITLRVRSVFGIGDRFSVSGSVYWGLVNPQ